MFEKAYAMTRVLKLVDVGPDLSLPSLVVGGRFTTSSATGMKRDGDGFDSNRGCPRQFNKDAADILNLFILAEDVLVAQQVSEPEFLGFRLRSEEHTSELQSLRHLVCR